MHSDYSSCVQVDFDFASLLVAAYYDELKQVAVVPCWTVVRLVWVRVRCQGLARPRNWAHSVVLAALLNYS